MSTSNFDLKTIPLSSLREPPAPGDYYPADPDPHSQHKISAPGEDTAEIYYTQKRKLTIMTWSYYQSRFSFLKSFLVLWTKTDKTWDEHTTACQDNVPLLYMSEAGLHTILPEYLMSILYYKYHL